MYVYIGVYCKTLWHLQRDMLIRIDIEWDNLSLTANYCAISGYQYRKILLPQYGILTYVCFRYSVVYPECLDINECATTPCRNGGSCNNTIGSYVCSCPPGWVGKNCGHSKYNITIMVQYRHLIPAPVDRTSASAWLYKHQIKCIS